MADDVLIYDVRDDVAHITLNRPERLNAINGALADAMRDMWVRFENDPAARVGIVRGSGRAFCAGRDITPGAVDPKIPFQTHQAMPENGVRVFKPLIAAVHGYAMGAGYNLGVRGCDITIAGESAIFGYPEARAGIAIRPMDYTPYMPFKLSLEFALLAWQGGRLIGADRACEIGLVNEVVPDDALDAAALRWAGLLMEIPPLFIKSVKRGHYAATRTRQQADEREYLDYVWPQEASADVQEARAAFLEKRRPVFRG